MIKNRFFCKFKTFVKNLYDKNRRLFFMSVGLIVLLIALTAGSVFASGEKKSASEKEENISISSYTSNLESKLKSMLLKIKTVSEVDVLIMVDSTPKVNYLTESEESEIVNSAGSTKTITTKVVYEKEGSINRPVVVSTSMPKVVGVLIVTNKIDASTKLSIINSVSVVLNVDETCITILQER